MGCVDQRFVLTLFKTGILIIVRFMKGEWSLNDLFWETSRDILMSVMQLTRSGLVFKRMNNSNFFICVNIEHAILSLVI
jgi:hypothetical protein